MENNSNAREYRVCCPDSRSSALMPLIALLLHLGWQRFFILPGPVAGILSYRVSESVSLQCTYATDSTSLAPRVAAFFILPGPVAQILSYRVSESGILAI